MGVYLVCFIILSITLLKYIPNLKISKSCFLSVKHSIICGKTILLLIVVIQNRPILLYVLFVGFFIYC